MSFSNDFSKTRCPMCGQGFVNARKLNRHKRTCPAKEDDDAE
jgi:hypothetical protein